jgi:hypothetical protein
MCHKRRNTRATKGKGSIVSRKKEFKERMNTNCAEGVGMWASGVHLGLGFFVIM